MAKLTLDKECDRAEPRSRRGWMLLAAGLGAALLLGACNDKNHKNRDEDEDEEPPATP